MEMKHKHEYEHHEGPSRRKLHRDWRLWFAIGLMLAAMLVYIFSDNERFGFGRGRPNKSPPVPAANK